MENLQPFKWCLDVTFYDKKQLLEVRLLWATLPPLASLACNSKLKSVEQPQVAAEVILLLIPEHCISHSIISINKCNPCHPAPGSKLEMVEVTIAHWKGAQLIIFSSATRFIPHQISECGGGLGALFRGGVSMLSPFVIIMKIY